VLEVFGEKPTCVSILASHDRGSPKRSFTRARVGVELTAAVFERPGTPLALESLHLDEPRAGEVLVRLAASGVCHSDYHVVLGEWSAPTPIVLGHEGAGVVEAVGEGVTTLAAGDHVILSWTPYCGRCRFCLSGRLNLCTLAAETAYASVLFDGTTRLHRGHESVYSYLAVGSFASHAIVAETGAVRIRDDVPLDRAAIVGCAVTTGVGAAINTARVQPGASVLVIGCGGVGLSVIMGAALVSGLPIIAVDLVESKLELARRVGATEVINASATNVADAVCEITVGAGVDYAFEAIGKPETIELAYDVLAPGGTAVVVGQVPDGVTASYDPFVMSDREKTLTGSNYGSARPPLDFPRIIDLYMASKLDLDVLVSRHIQLHEINDAFEAIRSGEVARSIITYPDEGATPAAISAAIPG
jgi:S-(hydroxymethyl)glutathione dehydrogenase/alcohol dehydrogenase